MFRFLLPLYGCWDGVSIWRRNGVHTHTHTRIGIGIGNRGCYDDTSLFAGSTAGGLISAWVFVVVVVVAAGAAVHRGSVGIHRCRRGRRSRRGIGLVEVMQLVEDARLLLAFAALLHAHLLQLFHSARRKREKSTRPAPSAYIGAFAHLRPRFGEQAGSYVRSKGKKRKGTQEIGLVHNPRSVESRKSGVHEKRRGGRGQGQKTGNPSRASNTHHMVFDKRDAQGGIHLLLFAC